MKKKLVGLMFAATMLFGASMTVFAADVSPNDVSANDLTVSGNEVLAGGSVTMESEVQTVHLEVTITNGAKVFANPYGLEIGSVDDTLIGTTIKFENKSNTAISVGLTGQIKLYPDESKKPEDKADQVTIATSAPTTAKSKQVFIQAAITSDDAGTKKLQTSAGKEEKALVYSAAGAKMTNAPVLAAAGKAGTDQSSDMVLTLTGATSQSPTSAWTDDDVFKVITTYDIQFGDKTKLSTFK